MKFKEIIFVLLCAGGLIIPAWVVGQYWLLAVFVAFFVCFGIIEAISVKKSGKSVSQHFWKYAEDHPVGKWVVLGCMLVSWLALLVHLGWH